VFDLPHVGLKYLVGSAVPVLQDLRQGLEGYRQVLDLPLQLPDSKSLFPDIVLCLPGRVSGLKEAALLEPCQQWSQPLPSYVALGSLAGHRSV
jgi:hypothetical protein